MTFRSDCLHAAYKPNLGDGMPNITKRWIDALKTPQNDTVWWDDRLEGFGVRATPAGSISFVIQYRNGQGRSRRLTIGPYGAYTPSKAREEAEDLLREAHAARKGKGLRVRALTPRSASARSVMQSRSRRWQMST